MTLLTPRQIQLWRWLVLAIVPLASFLSFAIQPVVGKILVPWHGGAASTWIGAMLFFQFALLLGYLWAYRLAACESRTQVRVTALLAVVAAAATLLPPPRLLENGGMAEVLLSLSVGLLPAMVLLFSTGTLLHVWLKRIHGEVPYFLYGVSNMGSLAALGVYPFWIEPHVGVGVQVALWRVLLVLLAAALVIIALGYGRLPATGVANDQKERVSGTRKIGWLAISALTCVCMLGATRYLAAEIGSNPLSWIGPLGIYLATFSLAFSGWWRGWMTQLSVALLAVGLAGFVLLKGVTAAPLTGWIAGWLALVTVAACAFGHGFLYALRPRRTFLSYYVVIAVGGVLGGFFSSLSAPNLLPRNYEFLAAAAALLALGVASIGGVVSLGRLSVGVAVAFAPVAGAAWIQQRSETTKFQRIHDVRNIYGHVQVIQQPGLIWMRSETTSHGAQIVQPESARHRPTMYYGESSAVGRVLQRVQGRSAPMSVGVIGLGAGTLAAYSRPGDTYVFWDLDPKILWLARTAFSFVKDAAGEVILIEADGRRGLETTNSRFDVLVVDAFSGDSIPPHLLTKEAFQLYLDHLRDGGLLVIHASNRYVGLLPVISSAAAAFGWEALQVETAVARAAEDMDLHPSKSSYVVVHRPEDRAEVESWFPTEEDGKRVTRELERLLPGDPALIHWSDDRHSITDVFAAKRYLFAREK